MEKRYKKYPVEDKPKLINNSLEKALQQLDVVDYAIDSMIYYYITRR